jgi:hypothetical protein
VKDAEEYLDYVKALIIKNESVLRWHIVREDAQGNIGLFRYRLVLVDGSLLEMFERFETIDNQARVTKYSFHWQSSDGQLRKRWDNAAHYPEIQTYPFHLHEGDEENVLPHPPVVVEDILRFISTDS